MMKKHIFKILKWLLSKLLILEFKAKTNEKIIIEKR